MTTNYHVLQTDTIPELNKQVKNFISGNGWELYGDLIVTVYGAAHHQFKYSQVIIQKDKDGSA